MGKNMETFGAILPRHLLSSRHPAGPQLRGLLLNGCGRRYRDSVRSFSRAERAFSVRAQVVETHASVSRASDLHLHSSRSHSY